MMDWIKATAIVCCVFYFLVGLCTAEAIHVGLITVPSAEQVVAVLAAR